VTWPIAKLHWYFVQVGGDGEKENKLLLFWPTVVIHKIGRESPLYKLSAADLTSENTKFEIIVVLDGIVEATGLTTQARSSYMPDEVLWGHRFQSITSSKSKNGDRVIDYSLFHKTIPTPTSPLSVYQIDSLSNVWKFMRIQVLNVNCRVCRYR